METDMDKKVLLSEQAPKAAGPYSLGIRAGNLIFLSGQLGIDPKTGNFVEGGVEKQTEQALTNLKNILLSNNMDMSKIVKTTVFLKDIKDFPNMNAVYSTFFGDAPPARSTIQVAALPKDGLVEIEAIAVSI